MRVALGADHAGFEMKQDLMAALSARGHEVVDVGTHSTAPVDYPDYAQAVITAMQEGRSERGLLVCGSGAGVSIAANKFPGIRASVCHDSYTAHQAVEHDDMNVLCLGARVVGINIAREIVEAFLSATFSAEDRHQRRVNKVKDIEARYLRT
jgi:RpiB/LacA/LacB family sugar-phosphate isomerase